MEVDGLEERCSLATCQHLDYLPFKCGSCKQQFCNVHHLPSAHSCNVTRPNTVPTCPLCESPVPVPPSTNPNDAMARHIDAGCPKRLRSNPQCALPTCSVRDPAATVCVSCRRVFCIAHCVEVNHHCTSVQPKSNGIFGAGKGVVPSRKPASSAIQPKPKPPTSSRANSALPGRLDFLNTPATPAGDAKVEPEDRISLSVFFPADTQLQPQYMFFSNKHSAGKVIDVLQKLVNLQPPPQGVRYSLYAIKRDLTRVNLMPYITPLRDLDEILTSGDLIVVQVGDAGLDRAWLPALQSLSAPRFTASAFTHKLSKLSTRKSNRCILA